MSAFLAAVVLIFGPPGCTMLGARRGEVDRRVLAIPAAPALFLAGLVAFAGPASDVSLINFVSGVLIAFLAAYLPLVLFAGLGTRFRMLVERGERVILSVLCLVLWGGAFYYDYIALIIVLRFTRCPPGAYECPI